jgi:hypothetical protein
VHGSRSFAGRGSNRPWYEIISQTSFEISSQTRCLTVTRRFDVDREHRDAPEERVLEVGGLIGPGATQPDRSVCGEQQQPDPGTRLATAVPEVVTTAAGTPPTRPSPSATKPAVRSS